MPDLNPLLRYTFNSRKGTTVTIRSRLGVDSARAAAMVHFWGPPDSAVPTRFGLGLDLVSTEEITEEA
jgi:hypothetical protein